MYELPIGKGRKYLSRGNGLLDAIIGGWEVGGVVNARTGLPIDITVTRPDIVYQVRSTGKIVTSPSVTSDGEVLTTALVNNPYGGSFRSNRRPDVVAGVSPFLSSSTDKRVFLNPAAFATPAPEHFGNLAGGHYMGVYRSSTLPAQEVQHGRTGQSGVPWRDLQYSQSHELREPGVET